MSALTKVQRAVLKALRTAGTLTEYYSMGTNDKFYLCNDGRSERIHETTVKGLSRRKLIVRGASKKIGIMRSATPWTLTERGSEAVASPDSTEPRAALAAPQHGRETET